MNTNLKMTQSDLLAIMKEYGLLLSFFTNFFVKEKKLFQIQQPAIKLADRNEYENILKEIYFSNLTTGQQMQMIHDYNHYLHTFFIRLFNEFPFGVFSFIKKINKDADLSNDLLINQWFLTKIKRDEFRHDLDDLLRFMNDFWELFMIFVQNDYTIKNSLWTKFYQTYLEHFKFRKEDAIHYQYFHDEVRKMETEKKLFLVYDVGKLNQTFYNPNHLATPSNFYTVFLKETKHQYVPLMYGYWSEDQQNHEHQFLSLGFNFEAFLMIYSQLKKIEELNFLHVQ
ncbi:hypothetical protein J2Z62_000759 [Mycoplasmoides fastidiosum]|uniref:Uncharacterized protein n=1 Tax=Mycoplasmoides fastidiosum TaxID=92758 RepID=A0ABU0M050_9BACT|nr:hypothetical protein [Mycoplasmoides fastidiosum]MDQ0514321.1 hypothetical protein [Mycoplasmoides fastidiosum]UUD38076.1 hypothetical protein NPA10_01630 [Mycoplasmoides fastidiosum]